MLDVPGFSSAQLIYQSLTTLVYRAQRNTTQESAILKVPAARYPTSEAIAQYQYAYETVGKKDIPGIIRVLGVTMSAYRPVLILEDIGGMSVAQFLSLSRRPSKARGNPSPPFALDEFFDLALQLTEALAAIRQHGIIHKNINPSNFILNRDTGEVRIADFGAASLLDKEDAEAVPPVRLHALAYTSPEQTGRMNRTVDHRSDLYALGVSLYQMLTGVLPFDDDDPVSLIHAHIARRAPAPHDMAVGIPAQVSDCVMHLMAKTVEERYQSAYGFCKDLRRCAAEFAKTRIVSSFPLGQADLHGHFQVSQKLYGREQEVQQLLHAFSRVTQTGRPALMLVAGYSGTGKTSLIHEIHKPLVATRGYFVSGKYDLLNRGTPYTALLDALKALIEQLLTEPEARLAVWKAALQNALAGNGQLMIDVVPTLELIIGPQPPLPELAPTESAHRFDRVFCDFVCAFARQDHPLTIFLDDLQWADAASLRLLHTMATSPEGTYLFILGAYRDHDVRATHLLSHTLAGIMNAGASVETITLPPLQEEHVNALLADSLRRLPSDTASLAALMMAKTLGNPFFLSQMLTSFYKKKLLRPSLCHLCGLPHEPRSLS